MPIPEYVARLRAMVGTELLMAPTVACVVLDGAGRVLLQRRSDNGLWGLPGGLMEPGEQPAETAVREVREETGIDVAVVALVGVYGGAEQLGAYPNGDRYFALNVTFTCRPVGGVLQVDGDETLELGWYPPDALPDTLLPKHRTRIQQARSGEPPYFARA